MSKALDPLGGSQQAKNNQDLEEGQYIDLDDGDQDVDEDESMKKGKALTAAGKDPVKLEEVSEQVKDAMKKPAQPKAKGGGKGKKAPKPLTYQEIMELQQKKLAEDPTNRFLNFTVNLARFLQGKGAQTKPVTLNQLKKHYAQALKDGQLGIEEREIAQRLAQLANYKGQRVLDRFKWMKMLMQAPDARLFASNPLILLQGTGYIPRKVRLLNNTRGYLSAARLPRTGKAQFLPQFKQMRKDWGPAKMSMFANHITQYPSWIGKMRSAINKKEAIDSEKQLVKKRTVLKDDPLMNFQKAIGNAVWNSTTGEWQGKFPNRYKHPQKALQRVGKTYAKSKKLLASVIDQTQVEAQVPLVIADLVNANTTLSKTGFGPIKKNGIALYAARWIDPVTGRVRLLPKASKDFINPLSYHQNIAFHQARLLNNWNKLVDDIQAYTKLVDTGPEDFQASAKQEFQKYLTATDSPLTYINKYVNAITSYYIQPNDYTPLYKTLVLQRFVQAAAVQKLQQEDVKKMNRDKQLQLLGQLKEAMQSAGMEAEEQVQNMKVPRATRMRTRGDIQRYVSSFTGAAIQRKQTIIKRTARIKLLGNNLQNPQATQRALESLDSFYTKLKNKFNYKLTEEGAQAAIQQMGVYGAKGPRSISQISMPRLPKILQDLEEVNEYPLKKRLQNRLINSERISNSNQQNNMIEQRPSLPIRDFSRPQLQVPDYTFDRMRQLMSQQKAKKMRQIQPSLPTIRVQQRKMYQQQKRRASFEKKAQQAKQEAVQRKQAEQQFDLEVERLWERMENKKSGNDMTLYTSKDPGKALINLIRLAAIAPSHYRGLLNHWGYQKTPQLSELEKTDQWTPQFTTFASLDLQRPIDLLLKAQIPLHMGNLEFLLKPYKQAVIQKAINSKSKNLSKQIKKLV